MPTKVDILKLLARQREALAKKRARRRPPPKRIRKQNQKDKKESDRIFGN